MKKTTDTEGTLLEKLGEMFPDSSKSTLRSWVEHKRIYVDGKPAKTTGDKIKPGQTIERKAKTEEISGGISLLYVDHDIVVIDKPAGLLSVGTDKGGKIHALAILKRHFFPKRIFVVHRLDRATSGVMIFARTEKALDALKKALEARKISRQYHAVVEGALSPSKGTWQSYLLEGKDLKMRPTLDTKNGELAITHYEVAEQNAQTSLLQIRLETGRKNQIRAHCEQAGHPIVGDIKYGAACDLYDKRVALHSYKLEFHHPITGQMLTFESPTPAIFQRMLRNK